LLEFNHDCNYNSRIILLSNIYNTLG